MKTWILIATLFVSMSASAKNKWVDERISTAAGILAQIAEGSDEYTLTPNSDPKKMILELALKEQMVESEEEFEQNWVGDSGQAWEVDGMYYGVDTLSGAYDYINNVLTQTLEDGERNDADKVKFAEATLKLNQAISILRSVKSVKFGVWPSGAVQCGVSFPSLLILDTENGKAHQIIMEGSGC